jgi:hypothetical protein
VPVIEQMEDLIEAGVRMRDDAACTCPLYVGGDPACYYHGLRDRHLPDLLAVDPPTWAWPYACHRHGHVWEWGSDRCTQCRAPYAEFGPEVLIAVEGS